MSNYYQKLSETENIFNATFSTPCCKSIFVNLAYPRSLIANKAHENFVEFFSDSKDEVSLKLDTVDISNNHL
jgi:hypothetical protein